LHVTEYLNAVVEFRLVKLTAFLVAAVSTTHNTERSSRFVYL
jgi:hypothetical protein